jgi:hypothetical protein
MLNIKIIIAIALLVTGGLATYWVPEHYREQGRAEAKAECDRQKLLDDAAAKEELVKANEKVQESQNKLAEVFQTKELQDNLKERSYEKTIESLRRDLRSSVYRLSIPTSYKTQFSATTSTVSGSSNQERAELLPETAISLIDIAAGANREVRRTNSCIDYYNAVRQELEKIATEVAK